MIYVNHDNKNAEAKNIPAQHKFIAFYLDGNALRRLSSESKVRQAQL